MIWWKKKFFCVLKACNSVLFLYLLSYRQLIGSLWLTYSHSLIRTSSLLMTRGARELRRIWMSATSTVKAWIFHSIFSCLIYLLWMRQMKNILFPSFLLFDYPSFPYAICIFDVSYFLRSVFFLPNVIYLVRAELNSRVCEWRNLIFSLLSSFCSFNMFQFRPKTIVQNVLTWKEEIGGSTVNKMCLILATNGAVWCCVCSVYTHGRIWELISCFFRWKIWRVYCVKTRISKSGSLN